MFFLYLRLMKVNKKMKTGETLRACKNDFLL